MAGKGPPPSPTAIHLLRGNPGKRPLPENEPQPELALPKPPANLSPAAKREWHKTGKKLLALGVISELDPGAFAIYCQNYTDWLATIEKLNKTGMLLKRHDGDIYVNPLFKIAAELQAASMRALIEFGMTPSSRTRVKAIPRRQKDEAEEFLRGRQTG